MKNLIVSLAVVFATAITPALAGGTNDDPRAEKVLTTRFAGAENIKWTKLSDSYQQAAFTLNGVRVEAFFNRNAELLGTVRSLFYNQLPLVVMQKVSNEFAAAVIVEVKEITNTEGTGYRIVLEQKNKKYSLKLNSLGEIIELQKEKLKK